MIGAVGLGAAKMRAEGEDILLAVVKPPEPEASPELGPRVIGEMSKVREAMHLARSFQAFHF